MNATNQRRLVIMQTPEREGLIYEVVAPEDDYRLEVELSALARNCLGVISVAQAWRLSFRSPTDSTVALVQADSPEILFSSADGHPRGLVREARLSAMGKAVVESETGQVLGSIAFGFKTDRVFLGNGLQVGSIQRSTAGKMPPVLLPPKTHLVNRFEFVHKRVPEFDDRLLYAFVCRQVLSERST